MLDCVAFYDRLSQCQALTKNFAESKSFIAHRLLILSEPESMLKQLRRPPYLQFNSIVAVHGLNGGAQKTWTSDKNKICWLSDNALLPKYLPNARVLAWGYNANVTSAHGRNTSSDRILQHAQTLIADLHADREVGYSVFRPAEQINLADHHVSSRVRHSDL